MKSTEKQMQPINTYERMYEQTIGNITGYKKRLRDLLTWDKPIVQKSISDLVANGTYPEKLWT